MPTRATRLTGAVRADFCAGYSQLLGLGEKICKLLVCGPEPSVICAMYPFAVIEDFLELLRCLGPMAVLTVVSRKVPAGIEDVWMIGSQCADQVG